MFKSFKNGGILGLSALALCVSSSAFAYGGWAAIVINPNTNSWGSFHGSADRADAEANALNLCGANCAGISPNVLEGGSSGLRETYAFNGWVAFARDAANPAIIGTSGNPNYNAHANQGLAEQSALDNCAAAGGQSCYVVRSLASFEFSPDLSGTDIQ